MTTLQEIYNSVNSFRQDPISFSPSCIFNKVPRRPLVILPELEIGAMWQATHLCEPVTHNTCPEWCFMFNNSCSHVSRIKHFLYPNKTANENEVLVIGPKRPFKYLVKKVGHCEHLLSQNINSMGGAIFNNIFILSLVWLI